MLEKIPWHFWLLAFAVFLAAGPAIFFAFAFGGAPAGAVVVTAIGLFYVVLYMLAVRWYS